MTDDLVKRLRTEMWDHEYKIQKEAADRIEKLEAALRNIIEQGDDAFPSPKDMIWTARKALEGKDE
jgi:hypothetical protein